MQVDVAPDLQVSILLGKNVFHTSSDPDFHGLGFLIEISTQKRKRNNDRCRKETRIVRSDCKRDTFSQFLMKIISLHINNG